MSVASMAGIARDRSTADPASYASTGSGDSFGRSRRAETSPEQANQPAEFHAATSDVPGQPWQPSYFDHFPASSETYPPYQLEVFLF